jgi:putative ABC transport system permease protein
MLQNYLKIAFRNLWKNKLFSFINIFGLGLAMAICLLSLIQIQNVFEFDNFHPFPERTFRILTDSKDEKGKLHAHASSPFLLSEKLKNEYGGIEKSARMIRYFQGEMNNRIKTLNVNGIYVDPEFFEIFGFPLEKGSPAIEPRTVVLNHETAQKFFGDTNPIGQTITHRDLGIFTVSGVLKPYKLRGTHFRSDLMVSMATFSLLNKDKTDLKSWKNYDTYTFVLLQKNTKPEALDHALGEIATQNKKDIDFGKQSHSYRRQAISDISPDFENLEDNAYVDTVTDLAVNFWMALVIIILAGFNYTNLTLAKSLNRAKEVGVRKVSGAVRGQLMLQFLVEATILALFALLVAFVVLRLIKQFVHASWITWEVDNQWIMWVFFVGFAILSGFMAGVFPARILSSFQPVQVLKGELGPSTYGKLNLRKSLIVIQFVATLVFMIFMTTMYNQFDYMATENDNFNRKNILNVTLVNNDSQLISNEISRLTGVQQVGKTSSPFGGGASMCYVKENRTANNSAAHYYSVDNQFIENMKLTFLAGKNLPKSSSDSATNFVVLNEKALKTLHLGTPQEAIGKAITLNNTSEVTVMGVVKDFCFGNYQMELTPLVLQYNPSKFQVLSVKTAENASETMLTADIEKVWKRYHPHDAMVSAWYEKQLYEQWFPGEDMKFMGMICLFGLVVAIMGLLGMVTYNAEKRYKEIGIRKVMGASEIQIVNLLSWEFLKLLIIAAAIAAPIGYFSGFMLLKLFTFSANMNFGLIGLCLASVFLISIFTIGFKAYQAALMNPVKSLKSE